MLKKQNDQKNNSLIALVLAAELLIFVVLSAAFIAYAADHECSGEDCPVCALMQQCEETLRQLGGGITALASALTAITVFIQMLSVREPERLIFSTPVSRKTRLND